jgi:hypothetical protein
MGSVTNFSQLAVDDHDGATVGLTLGTTLVTATAAELNILDGVTATAAELNAAADISGRAELVTTTNVITAAESGKTFFLNSATDFVSTLPAPAIGLHYTFIVKAAATTTAHTIVTNGGADIIYGAVATADGAASVLASAEDTISLTKTATGGIVGDMVEVESDGTNWYVRGLVSVAAGITFTAVI